MKNLFFSLLPVFLINSLSSLVQEISDFNGIETQSGRTYLFYPQGIQTPYNSIYKFDPEISFDTLLLLGYIFQGQSGDSSKANNDFEFFPNDSVNFI